MVAFGGVAAGAIAFIIPVAVWAPAGRGPAIHALTTAKENIVASINIFEVFMTHPLGDEESIGGS